MINSFFLYPKYIFRGIGQIVLQNSAITGIFLLVGVAINSPLSAGAIFLGTASATITAKLLDLIDIDKGIYGFNGALVGLATVIFLTPSPLALLLLIVMAGFSTILSVAISKILSAWNLPAFTASFVIVSWVIFLTNTRFGALETTSFLPAASLPSATIVSGTVTVQTIIEGALSGVGQVLFQASAFSGLIFLLALLLAHRASGFVAIIGSTIAVFVAWIFGGAEESIRAGVFGFNSVLVGIALINLLSGSSAQKWTLAIFAMTLTPFIYIALSAALDPIGVPALTMPFVLISWVFLLTSSKFGGTEGD